jgi:hypothetical protein
LIIDSLDALRAEASQRVFRQVIRQVHRELPEWKVVASIRSFDAKESLELHQLFPSSGGVQAGFNARHIIVPVFDDTEIEEAKRQDARLVSVFQSASFAAREILRNAFNLWLVIHLLENEPKFGPRPSHESSRANRYNQIGQAAWYLGSDEKTAAVEVMREPKAGQSVCMAKAKLLESMVVLDLRSVIWGEDPIRQWILRNVVDSRFISEPTAEIEDTRPGAIQGGTCISDPEVEVRFRQGALPRPEEERQPIVRRLCPGELVYRSQETAALNRSISQTGQHVAEIIADWDLESAAAFDYR